MIFRAMPEKIPGFGVGPKEHCAARFKNGNRKFTIFAIQLLPRIKTVADPFDPFLGRLRASAQSRGPAQMSKQASAKVEAECQATVFRSAGQQAFLWMLKLDGKPGRDTYVQLPELAESARTSEWLCRCCDRMIFPSACPVGSISKCWM